MTVIAHAQRAHARLSASRAERFMLCPGSVKLESRMPWEPPGEAAAIGTAIHELSEAILRGDAVNPADYADEHWNMATEYAEFVNNLCEAPRRKLIEVNLDAGLQSLHPALGGTADAVLTEKRTLHVVDLKTGRIPVSAHNNKQMLTYALGAMRQFEAPADIDVAMHIFQPRTGHNVWVTDGLTVIKHGHELKAAAEAALGDDPPINPGGSQCQWCRAKPICPALRERVQDAARTDFSTAKPNATVEGADFDEDATEAHDITADVVEDAQLAIAWGESVINAAKQQIANGRDIEGWQLRKGRQTRFWRDEAMVREALKAHPEAFDLRSPTAVAKLGIELSDDLVGVKESAPSLVRAKASE